MKKLINGVVLVIIILLVGNRLLENGFFDKDVSVACSETYNVELNTISFDCEVEDDSDVISVEHPLSIELIGTDGITLETIELEVGNNTSVFDELDFNTPYTVKVNGFTVEEEVYSPKEFYLHRFHTVLENFELPVVTSSNLVLEDISIGFDITVVDTQSTLIELSVVVMEGSNIVKEVFLSELSDQSVIVEELSELTEYKVNLVGTYSINEETTHTSTLATLEGTTLKTPDLPTADLDIVSNDNVELITSVVVSNEDGTSVSYIIALETLSGDTLQSISLISNEVTFDISDISTDFKVVVYASYFIGDEYFTNEEISNYTVTTFEYANFFSVPGLEIVDTSLELMNKDHYEDYIYTHLNEGNESFRIDCHSSIDCADLVNDEPYASVPFNIIGMVNSFYVTKNINYSFTSSYVEITLDFVYSEAQKIAVENEIDSILNIIIVDGMTDLEKITAVHDFVINGSVYDTACYDNEATCDTDHNAYGILLDNNGVCEGYSHAIDLLLRALRIPSIRISSNTHQWNGIYYDGEWLHLDATWDDPVTNDGSDLLLYDYFLIDTTTLHTNDDTNTHVYSTLYVNFME